MKIFTMNFCFLPVIAAVLRTEAPPAASGTVLATPPSNASLGTVEQISALIHQLAEQVPDAELAKRGISVQPLLPPCTLGVAPPDPTTYLAAEAELALRNGKGKGKGGLPHWWPPVGRQGERLPNDTAFTQYDYWKHSIGEHFGGRSFRTGRSTRYGSIDPSSYYVPDWTPVVLPLDSRQRTALDPAPVALEHCTLQGRLQGSPWLRVAARGCAFGDGALVLHPQTIELQLSDCKGGPLTAAMFKPWAARADALDAVMQKSTGRDFERGVIDRIGSLLKDEGHRGRVVKIAHCPLANDPDLFRLLLRSLCDDTLFDPRPELNGLDIDPDAGMPGKGAPDSGSCYGPFQELEPELLLADMELSAAQLEALFEAMVPRQTLILSRVTLIGRTSERLEALFSKMQSETFLKYPTSRENGLKIVEKRLDKEGCGPLEGSSRAYCHEGLAERNNSSYEFKEHKFEVLKVCAFLCREKFLDLEKGGISGLLSAAGQGDSKYYPGKRQRDVLSAMERDRRYVPWLSQQTQNTRENGRSGYLVEERAEYTWGVKFRLRSEAPQ